MPRYLVLERDSWEPDWDVIEAATPEEAERRWEAKSEFYEGQTAIVAEVRIDRRSQDERERDGFPT